MIATNSRSLCSLASAAACLFSLAANCIVNCSNMLITFSHFYNFKRFIIFLDEMSFLRFFGAACRSALFVDPMDNN